MDPELLALDDLPAEAREAIDQSDHDVAQLRDRSRQLVDEIRSRADQEAAEIEARTEEEIRRRQLELFRFLRPLQDAAAREGRLDEALAIRERLRGLRSNLLAAQADPGNLAHLRDPQVGSSLLFEVTGSSYGSVWGTDIYTADSNLSAVAVHSGCLNDGERGMVRITFVDTLNVSFTGSERFGVRSDDFAAWPVGYRISRA
ncbi:MAG: LCCL domain-containing protein [Gemmataceae bacterium]